MLGITAKPDSWNQDTAVVLAHGAGQGMHSRFMTFFHEGLADRGYLSVKFNFEYVESGRKVPDTQAKMQARYQQIVSEVRSAHSPRRIIIGGKSMGGRVASYIASAAAVQGLVFLGYPLHPPGKTDQLRDTHLYGIALPMLFVSGTKDSLARADLLSAVVRKIGPRAELHWIEGGDHSLQVARSGASTWPATLEAIDGWLRKLQPRL